MASASARPNISSASPPATRRGAKHQPLDTKPMGFPLVEKSAAKFFLDRVHQRTRPGLLLRPFRLRGNRRLRARRRGRGFRNSGLWLCGFYRLCRLVILLFFCHFLNLGRTYYFESGRYTKTWIQPHASTGVNAHYAFSISAQQKIVTQRGIALPLPCKLGSVANSAEGN